MNGDTPESIWIGESGTVTRKETADIFETSMANNFAVGNVIIKAILAGEL